MLKKNKTKPSKTMTTTTKPLQNRSWEFCQKTEIPNASRGTEKTTEWTYGKPYLLKTVIV